MNIRVSSDTSKRIKKVLRLNDISFYYDLRSDHRRIKCVGWLPADLMYEIGSIEGVTIERYAWNSSYRPSHTRINGGYNGGTSTEPNCHVIRIYDGGRHKNIEIRVQLEMDINSSCLYLRENKIIPENVIDFMEKSSIEKLNK